MLLVRVLQCVRLPREEQALHHCQSSVCVSVQSMRVSVCNRVSYAIDDMERFA